MPRATGKGVSLGCRVGGTNRFLVVAEVPNRSAAVVFYGMSSGQAEMATVEPTIGWVTRLDKRYQYHIYPGATQFFMSYQVEGRNGEAVAEAWPAASVFFRQATKQV
jgi:hypothetical protein